MSPASVKRAGNNREEVTILFLIGYWLEVLLANEIVLVVKQCQIN